MTQQTELKRCSCGGVPRFQTARVSEDYEDCWVECPSCKRQTEPCEDNYADYLTAAADWNADRVEPRP